MDEREAAVRPVKATTITRTIGTIRKAIRNSATPTRIAICAGLPPRRTASDGRATAIVERADTRR